MKYEVCRVVYVIYFGLCVLLSSCGLAERPRLTRDDAIRIAEEKVSHDLAGSPWSYYRISASYLPEDHKWVVAYGTSGSASRFTVDVDDRTRESQIWMPR
jgi:hypothetical protein